MKHFFILTFYFLRSLAMLITPGGRKSLVAENIMLRKLLIIVSRRRKRAPNLNQWQRLFFAFFTAIINPKRLIKTAIAIKPSLLIKFHKALIKRKYSAFTFTGWNKKVDILNIENMHGKRIVVGFFSYQLQHNY